MASAFKMAGRSKYHNLSLDYVDQMSFHLSLESLHHVRLSMHVLLYPGKSDSGDYRHSRNHVDGFIEMCNDKQKKPEAKTVLQVITNTTYNMNLWRSTIFVDNMYGVNVNNIAKITKFELTPNLMQTSTSTADSDDNSDEEASSDSDDSDSEDAELGNDDFPQLESESESESINGNVEDDEAVEESNTQKDKKRKDKQTTQPKRTREKLRIFELLSIANAGRIIAGRKMHRDFFLNLISQVQSPLQTADKEERDKPRNTEIADLESMLSGFFGMGKDAESNEPARVVDMGNITRPAATPKPSTHHSAIRIILNAEKKNKRNSE
eukprot:scaffold84645_cov63-Attheya_sp.AAC.2